MRPGHGRLGRSHGLCYEERGGKKGSGVETLISSGTDGFWCPKRGMVVCNEPRIR